MDDSASHLLFTVGTKESMENPFYWRNGRAYLHAAVMGNSPALVQFQVLNQVESNLVVITKVTLKN